MENITYIPAKTIVSGYRPGNDWFGANYNMNIYRGCSHGCIYCDSRSECYGDSGFDTIKVKRDALPIIRGDLRRKTKKGVVASGAMSDPYNALEEELKLTRHSLELISSYGFGAAIATKSSLVTRDIDVLSEIAGHSPVICKITVTTADNKLAEKLEPCVSSPEDRFEAVGKLSSAGIFTGILLMPVLPFITDSIENILEIVKKAGENGARFIYPAFGVTLRDRQREHFYSSLDSRFPGLRERYERTYGGRYSCGSARGRELWSVFSEACRERGLLCEMPRIIAAYKSGYSWDQASLFD